MAYGSCDYQKTPKLLVFDLECLWDCWTTVWSIQLTVTLQHEAPASWGYRYTGLGVSHGAVEVIQWLLWKDPKQPRPNCDEIRRTEPELAPMIRSKKNRDCLPPQSMFSRMCSFESWNVWLLFIESTVSMSRTFLWYKKAKYGESQREIYCQCW